MCDLNALYRSQPALHQVDFEWQGYEWLELHDWENSVIAFLRRARNPDDAIVVVCNFTPVVRDNYRIGVPTGGYYREILNTDSEIYGGSNVGNHGGVLGRAGAARRPAVPPLAPRPPLGVLFLKTPSTSSIAPRQAGSIPARISPLRRRPRAA